MFCAHNCGLVFLFLLTSHLLGNTEYEIPTATSVFQAVVPNVSSVFLCNPLRLELALVTGSQLSVELLLSDNNNKKSGKVACIGVTSI